jgi:hypothetical protein
VSGSENGRPFVWDALTAIPAHARWPFGFPKPLYAVAWHPTQHLVAVASFGGEFPVLVYEACRETRDTSAAPIKLVADREEEDDIAAEAQRAIMLQSSVLAAFGFKSPPGSPTNKSLPGAGASGPSTPFQALAVKALARNRAASLDAASQAGSPTHKAANAFAQALARARALSLNDAATPGAQSSPPGTPSAGSAQAALAKAAEKLRALGRPRAASAEAADPNAPPAAAASGADTPMSTRGRRLSERIDKIGSSDEDEDKPKQAPKANLKGLDKLREQLAKSNKPWGAPPDSSDEDDRSL